MQRNRSPYDEPHEHLCLHCGRWSAAGNEDAPCPHCHRESPAIHTAHQLLGVWGLNAFLEEQGVGDSVLDPGWLVRVLPGEARDEVIFEAVWTSAEPTRIRRLLKQWSDSAGLEPALAFRARADNGTQAYVARETYSLQSYSHPAALYRVLAQRLALLLGVLLSLADAEAEPRRRVRPPTHLSWAAEWLTRFLAAPPLLDGRRLGERYCVRCWHDLPGFYEPSCSYFRDNPEFAWSAGVEPWYDLTLALGEQIADREFRPVFLNGPEDSMPPVPLDGPDEAFGLIGRVLSHFRPRRCPGFIPARKMLIEIEDWSAGKRSLVEVARATMDPMIVRAAGDRMHRWLSDLFEGKTAPSERRARRPGETAFATARLLNLAEWLSASALDMNNTPVTGAEGEAEAEAEIDDE